MNTFQPPSRCGHQSQQPAVDVTGLSKPGACSDGTSESVSGLTLEAMDIEDSGDGMVYIKLLMLASVRLV